MMGAGKTTLGKIVAKKQDLRFIDTDSCIEEKFSMKIFCAPQRGGSKKSGF